VTRARWALLAALLVAFDAYLLLFRRGDVLGNVEAQFIITTPGFIVSHVLHARRAERHHAQLRAELRAATLTARRPPPGRGRRRPAPPTYRPRAANGRGLVLARARRGPRPGGRPWPPTTSM
jgi:hypothetical protein